MDVRKSEGASLAYRRQSARLALVGCIVMLFNWIVINFAIAGLHSYA